MMNRRNTLKALAGVCVVAAVPMSGALGSFTDGLGIVGRNVHEQTLDGVNILGVVDGPDVKLYWVDVFNNTIMSARRLSSYRIQDMIDAAYASSRIIFMHKN